MRLFFLITGILSLQNLASAAPLTEYSTPEITVLGQSSEKKSLHDYVPTVTEISGRKLERKKQATLGETLSQEAGITSSFFGPNASRPVIRGLDGERVRVLQNGVGTLDASGTSPDHAIPLDPFLTEQVEVVRGSAALLYGNSAVGGVVNTLNSRIPNRLEFDSNLKLNTRISSNDWGRTGGVIYQNSKGPFAFHIDGVARAANNYQIPGYARSARLRALEPLPLADEMQNKVENSQNQSLDGAVGGSYVGKQGYLGASLAGYGSQYGTVAEPDVRIHLNRERLDLSGEFKPTTPSWIQSAQYKGALSHYKHQELEGEEIGTTFRNQGAENRIDIKHRPMGGILDGIVGAQQQYSRFSAIGEEAFLPTTLSQSVALFTFQEIKLEKWTPSFGLRLDRSSIATEDETKNFWAPSAAAGLLYSLNSDWKISLNETYTQRAPNYQEIFADGAHLATGIFEKGDLNLKNENAFSHELSLRHKTSSSEGRISGFLQDYSRFIALIPTAEIDKDSQLAVFEYTPISAQIYGAEAEYRQELPWRIAGGFFELGGKIDWIRGLDRTHDTFLPRMTPMRESLSLHYRWGSVLSDLEIQHSEFQGLVAQNEIPTEAYTQINLGAEMPLTTPLGVLHFMARVNNLLDAEVRNHVSVLKDRAPLPGRNVILGVQAQI